MTFRVLVEEIAQSSLTTFAGDECRLLVSAHLVEGFEEHTRSGGSLDRGPQKPGNKRVPWEMPMVNLENITSKHQHGGALLALRRLRHYIWKMRHGTLAVLDMLHRAVVVLVYEIRHTAPQVADTQGRPHRHPERPIVAIVVAFVKMLVLLEEHKSVDCS